MTTNVSTYIYNIQILRAFAALLVVLNHIGGVAWGGFFSYCGGFGVDIFFILTGYLMILTYKSSSKSYQFFFSRVKRIYPTYIIVAAPLIIYEFIFKHTNFVYSIQNFLLLPGFNDPNYHLALAPGWTLVYEMIFYAMLSLAMLIAKEKWKISFLITSEVVLCLVLFKIFGKGFQREGWVNIGYILKDNLNIDFLFGCILCVIVDKFNISGRLYNFVFPATAALCSIFSLFILIREPRLLGFGVPALAIVASAVICAPYSGRISRAFSLVGKFSYSLYLSHIYFAILLSTIVNKISLTAGTKSIVAVVMIALSICFGYIVYQIIESKFNSRIAAVYRALMRRGAALYNSTVGN